VDDNVFCLIEGSTLPFEQTLFGRGRGDLTWQVRVHFRRIIEPDLIEIVERHTGRSVRCMLSDFDPERSLTVLLFVLAE
jgi:uncharacterized protein YbcI